MIFSRKSSAISAAFILLLLMSTKSFGMNKDDSDPQLSYPIFKVATNTTDGEIKTSSCCLWRFIKSLFCCCCCCCEGEQQPAIQENNGIAEIPPEEFNTPKPPYYYDDETGQKVVKDAKYYLGEDK